MSLSSSPRTGSAEVEVAQGELEPEEILELLDADYTRAILSTIRTEAKPARALAEECGASRPTVYRRLNKLREAGFVDTSLTYDADGHHRTVFEATLESITLDVTDQGLSVSVETRGSGGS